mmetsp:Transcript_31794/g.48763  ORF Transcript_31794/g.48763 Transcript_31794/m.48763 type:complete len:590 (+) Transcript_31794:25-1794(+)|eukprot:CAMPEP_0195292214 /NCGR_PEP_ID=MMETSP0707-20130614/8679_1 /TAXON_ID=33640 /ORGANISM="Asterionellopsis glacialis, Strain CCMP134" /LENGTH=589 /DNA_ID=CAMNT_0040352619 /DNA_START=25 /DNA_END=1794 /DNA_ORIENTATION=-
MTIGVSIPPPLTHRQKATKVSKKGMARHTSTGSESSRDGSGSSNSRNDNDDNSSAVSSRNGEKSRKKGSGTNSKTAKFQKAPNAPKRFKSAYMFFSTSKHKEIRSGLGTVRAATEKTTTIAKMVSKAWKELPEAQRATWEEMARLDKARYEAEKAEYKGPWKVPKTKRQQKDPNAPKRPMSAFIAYSVKKRSTVREEHPEASSSEIARILSNMWKAAPESERQFYIDEEYRLRQTYKAEMKKWNEDFVPANPLVLPVQEEQELQQNFVKAPIAPQDNNQNLQQQPQLQLNCHNHSTLFGVPNQVAPLPHPGAPANLSMLQMPNQIHLQPAQAQDPKQQQQPPSNLLWAQPAPIQPNAMLMYQNCMASMMSQACHQQHLPNSNGGANTVLPTIDPVFANTGMLPAQQDLSGNQGPQVAAPTAIDLNGIKQISPPVTTFSAQVPNLSNEMFMPSVSNQDVASALQQQLNNLVGSNDNTFDNSLSQSANMILPLNTNTIAGTDTGTVTVNEAVGDNNTQVDEQHQASTVVFCPSSLSVLENNNNMNNDDQASVLSGESCAQSDSHSLGFIPYPTANEDFPIPVDDVTSSFMM